MTPITSGTRPSHARRLAAAALSAGLLVAGTLVAGTLAMPPAALAQDQSAATPKDVIFARKILMGSIGDNMDELDSMVAANSIDVAHGASHADAISVMLLAFPHLFPPASNEWKPGVEKDAGTDTFTAPEVWSRFADFYQRSAAAAKSAYNASRARNAEEFRKYAVELREGCDSCHAVYQKKD
jgi:cytochrome c556